MKIEPIAKHQNTSRDPDQLCNDDGCYAPAAVFVRIGSAARRCFALCLGHAAEMSSALEETCSELSPEHANG